MAKHAPGTLLDLLGEALVSLNWGVTLSWRMVVALVDIDAKYTGEDSPSRHLNTIVALTRRGLIRLPVGVTVDAIKEDINLSLTKKGQEYLFMALHEYKHAKASLEKNNTHKNHKRKKVA
jgi:hypothetical protein